MLMGECLVYSIAAYKRTHTQRSSWYPPLADKLSFRGPKVNSRVRLRAVYDSTINIILCVIIVILL